MRPFSLVQADFAAALLDAGRAIPDAVAAPDGAIPRRRFAVYRNNVVVGLVNAMRDGFTATGRIVGAPFFAAMAQAFVIAHPPRSPLLMEYGERFSDFIAGFAPAAELPYLADVARLEFARRRAYHAADVAAIDPARLAAIAPAQLPALRLGLHPSAGVLRSPHPVVTIWAMNSGDLPLGPIDEDAAEDALVVRAGAAILVRRLPPGGAAFVLALKDGAPLGAAFGAATADDPGFDLAANLAGLIGSGAIAAISTSSDLAQGEEP